MTHSVMLAVTPPINESNNSSQHLSSTFGLDRPVPSSYDTWLGPSQVASQHISDHQAPTSSGPGLPALSHQNSDIKHSTRPNLIQSRVIGNIEGSRSRSRSCENFGSAQGYSRTTNVPQQSRNYQTGKLFNRFRWHRPFRTETKFTPSTSSNIFKLWKWEILNCALAIGMLGAMYGILLRYDGRRIPDWGTAINLNTLIALMGTLLRAMLVFVVAEIIGQTKWKYFAGGGRLEEDAPLRRLIETSRFNDASQGALGAVKLVPVITRDPAALLAVMVMIISLGTGSFVQQAIQTRSCQSPVDSARASLPISRNITLGDSSAVSGISGTSSLVAAITSALAPDSEKIGSPISVGCPTGNCTFQNSIGGVYSTLGVCSLCADTSSLVKSTEWTSKCDPDAVLCLTSTANYTLPNGMSIQASFGEVGYPHLQTTELLVSSELELDWAGDLVSPDMKTLSSFALANITILTPNWLPTSSGYAEYVAAACTLYPCLRSYTGSISLGQLDEVLVKTVPVVPNVAAAFEPNVTTGAIQEALSVATELDIQGMLYNREVNFQAVQSPCLVNDTVWTKENKSSTLDLQRLLLVHADPDPSAGPRLRVEDTIAPAECVYSLEAWAIIDLSEQAAESTGGSCNITGLRISSPRNGTTIDCDEKYWLASLLADNTPNATSVIRRIGDFTDRLTNKMRMGLLNNPEAVSGQVLQAAVCSRIHYSWLTFPALLVAVTSGLLAWTMLRNSRCRGREMVWKSSILPFLFYGERFVVKNGEDVSGYSTEESRRDGPKEPLLNLGQMEAEAKQRVVRFDAFD